MAPILAVENLLSVHQFPLHVLTAEEEATGFPVASIANGRRSEGNHWRPTTTNSATWIRCVFDRLRALDFVGLDRGHNLKGIGVDLKVTNDATDFTGTYETAFDLTLPSVSVPGDIDDPLGVRTEEGAWLKRFPVRVGKAVEFQIDAMGAGLLPNIVGLHIGLSFSPEYFEAPLDDETDALMVEETQVPSGWMSRGQVYRPRQGTIHYNLNHAEYDQVRYHLLGQFGDGHPMWICFDDAQANYAYQVVRAGGQLGFPQPSDYPWRQGEIPFVESAPKRRLG